MKEKLRNYFKNLRKNADPEECLKKSQRISEIFVSSELFARAKNIMMYLPIQNEVATDEIIKAAFLQGKTVILPDTDAQTCEITPVVFEEGSALQKGAFSVDVPEGAKAFDKGRIDLVIVPGVAFSKRGRRIGFGKGCYDKFLKGMDAIKVGICYDFQLSNLILPDENDVEMDYIITPDGLFSCSEMKKRMRANYHTHTYLCGHASGTPREYVENAIANGLEILGFSDHIPCPFGNGFKSGFRVQCENGGKYFEEISALRKEFEHQIKIHFGYESEYYPLEFENALDFIKSYECDYMILGQHYINNEYDGVYSGAECGEEILTIYVNQVIEAVKTGKFSYVAHPDLVNFVGDDAIYTREITRLLEVMKENSVPAEFNLLGFFEKRVYPRDRFWELVAKVGNQVVIGCDAHSPTACANPEIYFDAVKKLEEFGIVPVDTIELKEVF